VRNGVLALIYMSKVLVCVFLQPFLFLAFGVWIPFAFLFCILALGASASG
jgi:hypothetical protein